MAERIILLVEDNPDDTILTRRALEKSDVSHRVEVARDGLEALDYLFALGTHADRKASDMPALILLDLKLPKVDGLEVLRRLRADRLTKLIPVIVLSSSDEPADVIESYGLGANSYIRKPVDFAEFTETVRALAHYWLRLNDPPPSEPA